MAIRCTITGKEVLPSVKAKELLTRQMKLGIMELSNTDQPVFAYMTANEIYLVQAQMQKIFENFTQSDGK